MPLYSSTYKIQKMIKKFAEELIRLRKPGLLSHINPDGDAIGSQLALFRWYLGFGAEPRMFNDDPVPAGLTWLSGQELIRPASPSDLSNCDGFVMLDGNHPDRFGKMSEWYFQTGKPVYLIDHHLNPVSGFFRDILWDPKACATALLVYRLFDHTCPDRIDTSVAEAIYSGILTDTGSFRFDTVTAETHTAIADLLKKGKIRPDEIHEKIYENRSLSQLHLLGEMLQHIRLYCDNQLAITYVTSEMMSRFGASHEELDGFVNYPLSLTGVKVSVLMAERDGRIKMSLRGKSAVNLNDVARKFQGGGHYNAAGAWHDGTEEDAISDLVNELADLLSG